MHALFAVSSDEYFRCRTSERVVNFRCATLEGFMWPWGKLSSPAFLEPFQPIIDVAHMGPR